MNEDRALILYQSILAAWTFLHKHVDNPPVTSDDWNRLIHEYTYESQKCFNNGYNEADGYSEKYDKALADYRLNVFNAGFCYLNEITSRERRTIKMWYWYLIIVGAAMLAYYALCAVRKEDKDK